MYSNSLCSVPQCDLYECDFVAVSCHKMCDSLFPLFRCRYPGHGLCMLGRRVYAPGYSGEEGQLSSVPICLCCAGETLADIRRYTDTQFQFVCVCVEVSE